MFDHHAIVFSPSGRYACREKAPGRRNKTRRKFYFYDLQEEICYNIYVAAFRKYFIQRLYWLDDTHVVVIFKSAHRKFKKITKIPDRALYEVNLAKQKVSRKKIIYTSEDEKRFSAWFFYGFTDGILTLNDQEYFVYAESGTDWRTEEKRIRVYDISQREMFNGQRGEFTWLRFIPKELENEQKYENVWINHTEACRAAGILPVNTQLIDITAHRGKLFLFFVRGNILMMDVEKYFEALKENSVKPSTSEYCMAVQIPKSMHFESEYYYQNGLLYLESFNKDDFTRYIRIWDIDANMITSQFMVDMNALFRDEGHCPKRMLHPSGYFIQVDSVAAEHAAHPSIISGRHELVTKKCFTFKHIPLKHNQKQMNSLKQSAINQIVLDKSQNNGMMLSFMKDGRKIVIQNKK